MRCEKVQIVTAELISYDGKEVKSLEVHFKILEDHLWISLYAVRPSAPFAVARVCAADGIVI